MFLSRKNGNPEADRTSSHISTSKCPFHIIVKSACVGAGTTPKISIPSFQCCSESSTVLKKVVFFFFLKVIPCIITGRV